MAERVLMLHGAITIPIVLKEPLAIAVPMSLLLYTRVAKFSE